MKRRARQVNELSVKRQNTNFDGDVETSTTPCTTNSEVSDKLNPHLLLHSLSAEEISTAPDITVDGIDFEEEDSKL